MALSVSPRLCVRSFNCAVGFGLIVCAVFVVFHRW